MSKATPNLKAGEKAMRKLVAIATKPESKELIPTLRKAVMEKRNELGNCPFCSHPITDTTVTYTQQTAREAIRKILDWCIQKGRHEFTTGDIKHLLDHTQYANLNHLVSFGGIVYRPMNRRLGRPYGSGHYGINRQRAEEFLRGERDIPVQIKRNRFTGERVDTASGAVGDLPNVSELIDEEGKYTQPPLTQSPQPPVQYKD